MLEFAKKHILPYISDILTIQFWIKITGQKVIHIFYHTVSDGYLPHINPLYQPKTIKEFKNDIDFILKYFAPVSINDIYQHITKEKLITKPSFHISFDDGLSEVSSVIAPILQEKGIPATVFVNSAFVDNKDMLYRYKAALLIDKICNSDLSFSKINEVENILNLSKIRGKNLKERILNVNYSQQSILNEIASVLDIDFDDFLQKQKPYLTFDEIKDLQHKGFTIGAHSIDHPDFAFINQEEKIRQTEESIKFVQKYFYEEKGYFAFPFSDLNVGDDFFLYLKLHVALSFGISGISVRKDSNHVQRIELEKPKISIKKRIKYCFLINFFKKCNLKNNYA